MNICSEIHHRALRQGGGTMTFFCPETGTRITGYVGPGGTFAPISIIPAVAGKIPILVGDVDISPFAAARQR